ncbi:16S rRNA (adenine(1518)-N(6)/adenine(1519)-N(6))-dimethyltransferase RsmA [Commensalibacter papalotli (ex Botero et al. 2024)]|uniref:Ribosomal RNA small subunit methyltransferase A n=1 Tax=Commensalibacter papalotli (ex Botero et al. 2024) TaxID=2972766 RepID=A0ABN8W9U0_9PROT|nr:16S rRNA (adenine(1518)-N(6)/adenine(1519)-N(6))-dimethyltransferase RsmA [Commensalibacter papalotli (ex Botero et al. 2024)]CAI3937151.1 16S rRNA A1518 and A1519 N6-dimethyltransferase RsmA/KsgA/DIM1 (may also have DNA glycosylase/AP lyase activity) (RsmA) (PDB:1QYR) [Commensalibacter papalotli (ex Botero et al. 2024)]CAI3938460.1 16S rRNA A1518 and A1519 N6-dimethyltransferase RsmA/KsgA/DIM1 (may also have DNA glycosylase/AP lyase activity) (RsmA) (PDB:1QYR) [Commensalibacter papalotli (ex 
MNLHQNQLPSLKESINKYNLHAKKSLGQHFLLDPMINQQIIALAGDLTDKNVIEVGPGPGGLTRALLGSHAQKIIGVEVDQRALQLLHELQTYYPKRFTIVEHDALKLDLTTLCEAPRQIVANLPYNIGTPLLLGWLRQGQQWSRLTLMFQQEVAERVCAAPNTEFYGRLSVIAQWVAQCVIVKHIPPGAFTPPPKVYSAVINIIPKAEQPSADLFKAMEKVTAAAFGQRRKMLKGALKNIGGEVLLSGANIDGTRRAETLTILEFDQLARLYQQMNGYESNLPSTSNI